MPGNGWQMVISGRKYTVKDGVFTDAPPVPNTAIPQPGDDQRSGPTAVTTDTMQNDKHASRTESNPFENLSEDKSTPGNSTDFPPLSTEKKPPKTTGHGVSSVRITAEPAKHCQKATVDVDGALEGAMVTAENRNSGGGGAPKPGDEVQSGNEDAKQVGGSEAGGKAKKERKKKEVGYHVGDRLK